MSTPRGTARALRRAHPKSTTLGVLPNGELEGWHHYDNDACCVHCGFDGAEWWHWKHNTYEGRASEAHEPICTVSLERRLLNAVFSPAAAAQRVADLEDEYYEVE